MARAALGAGHWFKSKRSEDPWGVQYGPVAKIMPMPHLWHPSLSDGAERSSVITGFASVAVTKGWFHETTKAHPQ